MIIFKNLTLIGTSHIASQSIKEVREAINDIKPDIVALELDQRRFISLMQKKKQKLSFKHIKALGLKGFLFNVLGAWAEEKLGKIVGVKPGSDMKAAAKTAKEIGAHIALIDQDITITTKNLMRYLTWKEKWRFLADLIKGIIFRKQEIEPFDLTKVPDEKTMNKMISKVRERYPSLYLALIKERNEVMAKNLYTLMSNFKDKQIIAIVGAGHEKEIIALIRKKGE